MDALMTSRTEDLEVIGGVIFAVSIFVMD